MSLENYLAKHQMYALFQNALEELLQAQPGDPLAHLEAFFGKQQSQMSLTMRPKVVLIGPTGSGKGRQAERVAKEFNVRRISPAQLLKEAGYKEGQDDVPDTVLNPLLFARIAECEESGWVLDGYPKTDLQAFALKAHTQPTHVVEFQNAQQKQQPVSEQTEEYKVFQTTLAGIQDVFRANITLLDTTGLEEDTVSKVLFGIIGQRPLVLDRQTREVLPRGPGLVGALQEQKDMNRDRVVNTKPRIEEMQ